MANELNEKLYATDAEHATDVRPEETLRTVRPAMFRKHPFRFASYSALLVVGVVAAAFAWSSSDNVLGVVFLSLGVLGALLLVWWWIEIRSTTLTVTSKRTIYRTGIVSRRTSEVRHGDVRNLQMDQTVLERIFGVGDIAISSSGQSGLEIVAEAIPQPESIIRTIRERQH